MSGIEEFWKLVKRLLELAPNLGLHVGIKITDDVGIKITEARAAKAEGKK